MKFLTFSTVYFLLPCCMAQNLVQDVAKTPTDAFGIIPLTQFVIEQIAEKPKNVKKKFKRAAIADFGKNLTIAPGWKVETDSGNLNKTEQKPSKIQDKIKKKEFPRKLKSDKIITTERPKVNQKQPKTSKRNLGIDRNLNKTEEKGKEENRTGGQKPNNATETGRKDRVSDKGKSLIKEGIKKKKEDAKIFPRKSEITKFRESREQTSKKSDNRKARSFSINSDEVKKTQDSDEGNISTKSDSPREESSLKSRPKIYSSRDSTEESLESVDRSKIYSRDSREESSVNKNKRQRGNSRGESSSRRRSRGRNSRRDDYDNDSRPRSRRRRIDDRYDDEDMEERRSSKRRRTHREQKEDRRGRRRGDSRKFELENPKDQGVIIHRIFVENKPAPPQRAVASQLPPPPVATPPTNATEVHNPNKNQPYHVHYRNGLPYYYY